MSSPSLARDRIRATSFSDFISHGPWSRLLALCLIGSVSMAGACSSGGGGGAATGGDNGAATGGSNPGSGGASTGGVSGTTGGASGTGGVSTGGRGAGTGGASTGGASTGGVSAGGRPGATGGASTGGRGGGTATGGTGTGTGGSGTGGSGSGTGGRDTTSCRVGPPATGAPGFGAPKQEGAGDSTEKYLGDDVTREGVAYRFITNWWGQGWKDASVSYKGTSFSIASANGTSMPDGTPIGYPATYCGQYSERMAGGKCGLPVAFSAVDKLWTGWRWSSADKGQYNAAWDIWLGTATAFQSYLMVWLRDPVGRQPAGESIIKDVMVAGEPGTWNIHYGTVNGRPIVNYVRAEGQDACEFEFNVMDFVSDAKSRSALTLPGDTVRAIAVGFEMWTGPFANVTSEDFYVKVVTK